MKEAGARSSSSRARRQQRLATATATTLIPEASTAKTTFQGPSHVLFSAFGASRKSRNNHDSGKDESETNKRQPRIDLYPRLETDYISKRQTAHESVSLDWTPSVASRSPKTPWEGTSGVEQELVRCCEGLPEDFYDSEQDNENDEENEIDGAHSGMASSSLSLPSLSQAIPIGGVLAVKKECRFAAILSRGCHTMASRSLAIAILERTLQAYLEEEATRAFLLSNLPRTDDEEEPKENESEESVVGTTTNEKDKAVAIGHPVEEENRRFRLFFEAGGLRILNQWLVEASSYETKTKETKTAILGKDSSNQKGTEAKKGLLKAHTTRPIALSILLFLENIPFEKKIVTNSKINKQVQKLGKKLLAIQEAHQNGEAPMEDLEHWTVSTAKEHDKGLARILEAVDAVKVSWREKAKGGKEQQRRRQHQQQQQQQKIENPFEPLQTRIRERLKAWNQFQCGALSAKPEWYRPVPPAAKKHSSSLKRKANSQSETEQLILQKKIKQMQSRSQQSLKQLREKLRKKHNNHAAHSGASRQPVPSLNRVSWKDGMKTQHARNREELEDIVVFGKDLPSSSVANENTSNH